MHMHFQTVAPFKMERRLFKREMAMTDWFWFSKKTIRISAQFDHKNVVKLWFLYLWNIFQMHFIWFMTFTFTESRFMVHWFKIFQIINSNLLLKYVPTYLVTLYKKHSTLLGSDESEQSWLKPGLELNNFQLGSWPFPFSSEISLLRLEN